MKASIDLYSRYLCWTIASCLMVQLARSKAGRASASSRHKLFRLRIVSLKRDRDRTNALPVCDYLRLYPKCSYCESDRDRDRLFCQCFFAKYLR
ncbi:hypothetical protein QUB47_04330 [Microcoleus sp. AT9_B5]